MTGLRICITVSLLFASPLLAHAQLRFAQPSADLGEQRGGVSAEHRFDFVNDAPTPIEIIDIRLGCGCMKPTLDKRMLQPGEKGSLLIHLRTLGQPAGVRSWQAFVQYRQAGTLHEVPLVLAAKIVNEITVEPSILAMSVQTTLRQTVTFTDQRRPPAKIIAVQASSRALKVTMQAPKDGVTAIMVEVSRADLTAEREEATLDLYTDDPAYRHLQVPITLTKAVHVAVTATPAQVELIGNDSRLVRLRGSSERTVRIQSAAADHPAIACTWASGPGNDATLRIRVNASLLTTPTAAASVRVTLAEPTGATLTIPVEARKK